MSAPYNFSFGEGADQWHAPNPAAASMSSMASAYHYLVCMCPDTKTAVAKLRAIRRAVRTPHKEPTR